MSKVLIEVPSIRDNEGGYSYLFRLADKVMSDPYNHFDFNFKKCAILDQNAVSMLGGLARYVDEHNSAVGLK
jgi:hypothetical protein